MDDEYNVLGKKIIKAVGLPLVKGTPEELASSMLFYSKRYKSQTKSQFKKETDKFVDEIMLIPVLKTELEQLLIKYDFFREEFPWRLHMQNIFREIDDDFPPTENSKSVLIEEIITESEPLPAHVEISQYYEEYFGRKPTYTYSELNGYVGPYWNFIRALRDYVGMDISEAAIRKANQRSKKETK